jgi:hypothetical protein
MAMRIWLALLGLGFGLTLLLPVVGVMFMLAGAVGLAIRLEDGLTPEIDLREPVDQPLHALEEPVAEVDDHGGAEDLQVAGDGRKFLFAP